MSDQGQFMRFDDRLDRELGKPGVRADVAAVVSQMRDADRRYVETLAEMRHAAQLTQADLGDAMSMPQAKVSRVESSPDMLLSTLTRYLRAVGEHPRVVVTIEGQDFELELAPGK